MKVSKTDLILLKEIKEGFIKIDIEKTEKLESLKSYNERLSDEIKSLKLVIEIQDDIIKDLKNRMGELKIISKDLFIEWQKTKTIF